ncbi:F0F1 ATP synthase subunit epsilon [Patescibacteria group bacterium]|nr:F0F1 ATP synthase subunit epsilon [Patescibacteria group bacterium]
MKTFHLTVARIGENLFDEEVVSVSLPGIEGTFQILAGHEPFVSLLTAGTVHIKNANGQGHSFETPKEGVAEISYSQATVLL